MIQGWYPPGSPQRRRREMLEYGDSYSIDEKITYYKAWANEMANVDLKLAVLLRDLQHAHEDLKMYCKDVLDKES